MAAAEAQEAARAKAQRGGRKPQTRKAAEDSDMDSDDSIVLEDEEADEVGEMLGAMPGRSEPASRRSKSMASRRLSLMHQQEIDALLTSSEEEGSDDDA